MSEVNKYIRPERPAYRILDTSGFFGPNDTLYEYLDEIEFDGEPAEQMEPLNEAARVKYLALLEKLDAEGRKTAEKLGRPFTGRPRSIDGAIEIATAVQHLNMSPMGNKDKNTDSIAPLNKDEPQMFGTAKRGPGRPKKLSAA